MRPLSSTGNEMGQPYSEDFFAGQQAGSITSASRVVPLLLSLFPIRSVVDVGCGVGGWLKEFERYGISDHLGLDGNYVPRHLLQIAKDRFHACDLTSLQTIGRRFDLACSLEVAEHLPRECAEQFVSVLVNAAPVVLFSAAVPGQGGANHLNERWQSYWAGLFTQQGYLAVDCVRPVIFYDDQIEWWYRQNMIVYCEPDRCPPAHAPARGNYDLDRIHPRMVEHIRAGPHAGKEAVAAIPRNIRVVGRAILRKAGLMR